MRKNKAFTLIELVSVLVILAILALIVTPLVLNIIREARTAADKRSIDAYGRSIELAVANYLLENGTFPTSIEELTIEYSGDTVICTTTQLNEDSSVYLSECTVKGRIVDYSYGKEEAEKYDYEAGDEVTYNDVDYYVIKNSKKEEQSVTLLKAEPLTVEEVNLYGGVGTDHNHINMYSMSNKGITSDINGYGGMLYYSSSTCGYPENRYAESGCTTDYNQSEIKYVVDAWALDKVPNGLKEARLITKDEYDSMTTEKTYETPSEPAISIVPIFDWLYIDNNSNWYWTMTGVTDSTKSVWGISSGGNTIFAQTGLVRPVIELSKSVL